MTSSAGSFPGDEMSMPNEVLLFLLEGESPGCLMDHLAKTV